MATTGSRLRVLSLNCRKKPEVFHSIINNISPNDADIICLQELPFSIDTLPGYRSPAWLPIYPTNYQKRQNKINRCPLDDGTYTPPNAKQQSTATFVPLRMFKPRKT